MDGAGVAGRQRAAGRHCLGAKAAALGHRPCRGALERVRGLTDPRIPSLGR